MRLFVDRRRARLGVCIAAVAWLCVLALVVRASASAVSGADSYYAHESDAIDWSTASSASSAPAQVPGAVGVRAGMNVVELYDSTFDTVTQLHQSSSSSPTSREEPWLIAFVAPWCPHCKEMAPVWSRLADDQYGSVHIGRMDATHNRLSSTRFQIEQYPTILYFHRGQVIAFPSSTPPTFDALKAFLASGWRFLPRTPLPPAPSLAQALWAELASAAEDVRDTAALRPDVALALAGLGVLVGVLLTVLSFTCCVDRSFPPTLRARAAALRSGKAGS